MISDHKEELISKQIVILTELLEFYISTKIQDLVIHYRGDTFKLLHYFWDLIEGKTHAKYCLIGRSSMSDRFPFLADVIVSTSVSLRQKVSENSWHEFIDFSGQIETFDN